MAEKIEQAIEALRELINDATVPRNIKEKLQQALSALNETNSSINVDKAMQQLEEVADDPNLQSYIRTQIWGVASLLEKNN
ncbi:MAG: UPF0147 family protein [Candidatus Woesearchaeota archaeon]